MKPLYREDLRTSRCDVPGCSRDHTVEEIYFHPACHMDSPTWVRYRADVITIECARCRQVVACLVVASKRDRPGQG